MALVLGCTLGGGLVGAVLPDWLSRLPEPELASAKTPYSELARARGLRPLLGVATAACFGLVAWRLGPSPVLPAELYLVAVGVLLCYIDIRVRLLPNAIILPSYLVVLVLQLAAAAITPEWESMLRALICAAGLWLIFAIAGFAYPAGVGFGDVKLIGLLGLGLGYLGVSYAVVGLILAFVLGGLVSLTLVITRRATAKSHMPFGPFLVAGFLLALIFAETLVQWYLRR